MTRLAEENKARSAEGSAGEVLGAFLKLGLTSFGGPVAHLGYFRDEFVTRRRWIDEAGYADLVALCQFLPGPASSQVGFALGLLRAGPLGAAAAWSAFTLPSASLMTAFALWSASGPGPLSPDPVGAALVHGLKLVAVAVVAQAVFAMGTTLAAGRTRTALALGALALAVLVGGAAGQLAAIGGGAVAGWRFCRAEPGPTPAGLDFGVSPRFAACCLILFAALFAGLPVLAIWTGMPVFAVSDAFYRSGALVFGGGHVVLPLLQAELVPRGWIGNDVFLAGYGAAQAMPGPLFTVVAYLGAALAPEPHGIVGAAVALASVFLPGLLVLLAAMPLWSRLGADPSLRAAMRGTNAAVVGLLAAALYDPVCTSAIGDPSDVLIAAAGFAALTVWRWPPLPVVVAILTAALLLR